MAARTDAVGSALAGPPSVQSLFDETYGMAHA